MAWKLRTFKCKIKNRDYISEMFKINKRTYNYTTTLDGKVIAHEENLEMETAVILEDHIKEIIKKEKRIYQMEN